jgi:outer membrane protein OmpA-like peptidoglycan-associated protein
MRARTWYSLVIGALVLALANSWLARDGDRTKPPRLVVVASHNLPKNHKLSAEDMIFAVIRSPIGEGGVARPQEAIGACTTVTINESGPLSWGQLRPLGMGDDSCANAAMALRILERVTQLPNAPAAPGSPPTGEQTPSEPSTVAPFRQWLDLPGDPPADLSPEMRAALGEFRAEFVKEFGKRLADNAGDQIFGRNRKEAARPLAPTDPTSPPKTPKAVQPTPVDRSQISYFDFDRAALTVDQRDLLVRFASELRRHGSCRITVFAYTDHVGTPRYNLWLSRERGNAVADVLVVSGLERRLITVVPRGYQYVAEDAGDAASASNRRVETSASCPAP